MPKKLRIAEFVTCEIPFPVPASFPRVYAPISVAMNISAGLSKKGHEVVFYGPKGSHSKDFKVAAAPFEGLVSSDIFNGADVRQGEKDRIFTIYDEYIISMIFKDHMKNPYDIIHIHPLERTLIFANMFPKAKIVTTLHDTIFTWRAKMFNQFNPKNVHLVSISDAQRKPAPKLNYLKTIYHGLDTKSIPFSGTPGDYLFFSGRLLEKKGVHEAILAAIKSNQKLKIAGAPAEGEYWDQKIKPYLKHKNIEYVGFINAKQLQEYNKNAKALLFPIKWEEPFGLVLIEAMATGTPVIAFNRGSVPEVMKHGQTGFVVDTLPEMVSAIKKIDTIDRVKCRQWVEEKFNLEQMITNYEQAFQKLARK